MANPGVKKTDKMTRKMVMQIPILYMRKKSIQKVADHFNVSWQCIWYWICKLNKQGVWEIKINKRGKKPLMCGRYQRSNSRKKRQQIVGEVQTLVPEALVNNKKNMTPQSIANRKQREKAKNSVVIPAHNDLIFNPVRKKCIYCNAYEKWHGLCYWSRPIHRFGDPKHHIYV